MARVVALSGSPSASSRTLRLLRHVGARLSGEGFDVIEIDVRDLPAEDLISARASSPTVAASIASIASASGIVLGTPIYKAAYSGVLKTFLDLLPAVAFSGKVVLPIMTGGAPAHALALDYALRPVLMALGHPLVVGGAFVLDRHIGDGANGTVVLEPDAEAQLAQPTLAFTRELRVRTSMS